MLERIEKGEQKIERRDEIKDALAVKVGRYKNAYESLTIQYGMNKGKNFNEDEDRYLVCKMAEMGYGEWEQMRLEIRSAWQVSLVSFLLKLSSINM